MVGGACRVTVSDWLHAHFSSPVGAVGGRKGRKVIVFVCVGG